MITDDGNLSLAKLVSLNPPLFICDTSIASHILKDCITCIKATRNNLYRALLISVIGLASQRAWELPNWANEWPLSHSITDQGYHSMRHLRGISESLKVSEGYGVIALLDLRWHQWPQTFLANLDITTQTWSMPWQAWDQQIVSYSWLPYYVVFPAGDWSVLMVRWFLA